MAKAKTTKPKKKTAAEKKAEASKAKLAALEATGPPVETPTADESDTVNGKMIVNEALAKKCADWPTEMIDVNAITFGDRYRKDPGDLHALAVSINTFGMLHPIGVEKIGKDEYKIVIGGRRLMATRDILCLPTIKATIFDPTTDDKDAWEVFLLQMELEENTQRVNPSMSESLERANLISRLIGKGVVTVPKGKKKRDIVAAAAGLSHETLRQSEVVFEAAAKKGASPEVKEIAAKLNTGEIAPTAAFKKLVEEESAEMDGAGIPIPKKMKAAFFARTQFETIIKGLQAHNHGIANLCASDGGERLEMLTATGLMKTRVIGEETKTLSVGIIDLVKGMSEAMPFAQCPPCAEEAGELGKHRKKCETCHGSGHISEKVYRDLEKAGDKSIAAIQKIGKAAAKAE